MGLPIRLSEKVAAMPGTAFGLSQALAVFQFEVSQDAQQYSAAFKHVFDQLLPQDRFGQFPLTSSEEVLLQSLLQLANRVLQESKHPVFSKTVLQKLGVKGSTHHFRAITPCHDFASSKAVFNWLFQQAQAAIIESTETDSVALTEALETQLQQLIHSGREKGIEGLNTFHFLKAADQLNIQATRIAGNCYWLGSGRKALLVDSSFTENTPVIGVRLAHNKLSTNHYLKSLGMPTAPNMHVRSEDEATTAAKKLGYPVAIKPIDKDGGAGVQAYLETEPSVRAAYVEAAKTSPHIMLEKHCPGIEYRVTVFRDQIIKIITRIPAAIIGDGQRSVSDLVADFNDKKEQLKRAWNHGDKALIELNQEALDLLEEQGLNPNSVPIEGQRIPLRRTANVSTGGTPDLYQGEVHPDNQQLCIRVARALGLDLAGIDIIMADMSRSWLESEANILEVNAMPQLGADLTPSIYRDVLTQLLPEDPHLKLTVVVGDCSEDSCYQQLKDHLQQDLTQPCGFASSAGVYVGQEQRARKPVHAFAAISTLLKQRDIEQALICMPYEEVVKFGLPFTQCDLVIIDQSLSKKNPPHLPSLQHILLPHSKQGMLLHHRYASETTDKNMSDKVTIADAGELLSNAMDLIQR